ncbi:MAG: prepilin-type N-terminal cleavage/methylation domain-containing protein [Limisphaerales bacterium]
MHLFTGNAGRKLARAYSLIEVVVAIAVASVIITALYLGISGGFALLNVSRQEIRATQIMVERLESIRLYHWGQINNTNFLRSTFEEYYYPLASNTSASVGLTYQGEMQVLPVPFTNSYSADMRMITVRLRWTNSGVERVREMSTFVSENGLQRYVF